MSRRLERLFEPIRLGSLELPNRIIMPAITTNYDFDKADRLASFYAERASGRGRESREDFYPACGFRE